MCSGFGKQRNWANPFAGKQYPSSSSSSHLLVGWFPICHMYVFLLSFFTIPLHKEPASQQTDHHPLSWLLWGCARWWFCCAEHGLWWVTATGQNQRDISYYFPISLPRQLSPWEQNYSHRHSVAKLRKYVWLRTFPGTSEWDCGQMTILLFVTVKGVVGEVH